MAPKAPVSRPPQPPPASTTPPNPPEAEAMPWLEEMPPRKIVAELDRYVVGQEAAKKAVAIAVRNRWRRAQAPEALRDENMSINMVRSKREEEVYPTAEQRAEERLLDLLLPPLPSPPAPGATPQGAGSTEQGAGSRPLFVVSSKGDVESTLPEAETEANERRRRT